MLWLKIIRPQTLFASLCPVLTALLVISQTIAIDWLTATITLSCALALQILSNLINDYYDFKRGTDQKGRVGFKRALAEGVVTERQMLSACLVTLILSILLGSYLVWVGGWPILLIGVLAILFAWLYTATNHSLSYLGIADIFVFLFYGIIAGWGTGYLQVASLNIPQSLADVEPRLNQYCSHLYRLGNTNLQLITTTAVNGLISMCVLIINNLRDIDSDKLVGKRTFPVRFGKRAGEIGMLVIVVLMPIFAWWAFHCWIPMLILLPAVMLFVAVMRAKTTQYNRCLFWAGMVNVCYVILVIIIQ